eukprot:Awhi_evm1s7148
MRQYNSSTEIEANVFQVKQHLLGGQCHLVQPKGEGKKNRCQVVPRNVNVFDVFYSVEKTKPKHSEIYVKEKALEGPKVKKNTYVACIMCSEVYSLKDKRIKSYSSKKTSKRHKKVESRPLFEDELDLDDDETDTTAKSGIATFLENHNCFQKVKKIMAEDNPKAIHQVVSKSPFYDTKNHNPIFDFFFQENSFPSKKRRISIPDTRSEEEIKRSRERRYEKIQAERRRNEEIRRLSHVLKRHGSIGDKN